ncbi:MAG TPA: lysophospholipid acyltransferase family protein [Polyangiaceae bacterium]|jgi:1-acyl-sn-glycerol-3-phosphate acyltransferase
MSLGYLLHAAYATLRISIPTIRDGLRGTLTPELCDQRLLGWSSALVERARIDVRVHGELPDGSESFVVMSNHQSLYDIPVLYRAFPLRLRMVAKAELFRVPLWAQAMRRAGFVELDRSDRDRAIRSLDRARDALSSGTNVWIAPEGTRSPDGRLGEFKRGGFYLAVGARSRILPVSIRGTRQVLAARAYRVKPGAQVDVTFHAAVDPKDFGLDVTPELLAAVHDSIERGLSET